MSTSQNSSNEKAEDEDDFQTGDLEETKELSVSGEKHFNCVFLLNTT